LGASGSEKALLFEGFRHRGRGLLFSDSSSFNLTAEEDRESFFKERRTKDFFAFHDLLHERFFVTSNKNDRKISLKILIISNIF
jgi:hypothetical protein